MKVASVNTKLKFRDIPETITGPISREVSLLAYPEQQRIFQWNAAGTTAGKFGQWTEKAMLVPGPIGGHLLST